MPLLDAFARSVNSHLGRRSGRVRRCAIQKISVVVHRGIAIIHAQSPNRIDELRRELVHHRRNQISSADFVFGDCSACLDQVNHCLLLKTFLNRLNGA